MRGLAERWRPRGLRPPAPAGRHTLPVVLAALAIVAAASTTASGARVAEAGPGLPPATVGLPSYDTGPTSPEFEVPSASSTSSAASSAAGRRPGGAARCALGRCGPEAATGPAAGGLAANGIPTVALTAYKAAEKRLAGEDPGCGVSWSLLAAIGRVESNHGRFAGSTLLADGRSDPPILGLVLDGSRPGVARIADTDGGRYDGDARYDRAVGPMQFIPGTWALFEVDGDRDGKADPFDIDDVSVAAARYLCKAGGDLRTVAGQQSAVYAYNHSEEYVRLVLDLAREYASGARVDTLPAPDRDPRPIHRGTSTLPPATVDTPPVSPTTTPTTTRPSATTPRPAPSSNPPSATRTPSPTPAPSPTCTPVPTTTPSGTPTGSPTTSPSPTPTPSPTTPSPTSSPTTTPTPSPTLPACPS